jgi:organic hydroperoxide reductase OsmC/OhrA
VEKTKEGLRFTSIRLHVEATTEAGQEAELARLIQTAEHYCIISGALRLGVELEIDVQV